MKNLVRLCATLVISVQLLSGCAGLAPVKPWEKGKLAKPSMRMDEDVLGQRFELHVYASKENSTGGYGAGGGGCGCN